MLKKAYQQTHQLERPRLWSSMIKLIVVMAVMNTHLDIHDKYINNSSTNATQIVVGYDAIDDVNGHSNNFDRKYSFNFH